MLTSCGPGLKHIIYQVYHLVSSQVRLHHHLLSIHQNNRCHNTLCFGNEILRQQASYRHMCVKEQSPLHGRGPN